MLAVKKIFSYLKVCCKFVVLFYAFKQEPPWSLDNANMSALLLADVFEYCLKLGFAGVCGLSAIN